MIFQWPRVHTYPELPRSKIILSESITDISQFSKKMFIAWCNENAINNPIIYLSLPNPFVNTHLLESIFAILPHINVPTKPTLFRKMTTRYQQTGFPITIKMTCISENCRHYVQMSSKWLPKSINKLSKSYFFCDHCKNQRKKTQNHRKQFDDLTTMMTDLSVRDNESMAID